MIPSSFPGCFIAFEGIDHCGKFTQLHKVRNWLEENGYSVSFYGEPNDQSSLIGKRIRQILQHEIPAPDPLEFQRMFVIDRAQNLICFLRPALENGHVMLLERYALSTLAFGMLNTPAEDLIELHRQILGPNVIWPDINLVIDISPEESIRRIAARKGERPQLFEKLEKLRIVRQNYIELSKRNDIGRTIIVSGEKTPEEVFGDIQPIIFAAIKSKSCLAI